MNNGKDIKLFIPVKVIEELDKRLKENQPTFKYQLVYFFYVIHYIIKTQLKYKDKEYISLNLQFLKSITSTNISRYITYLIKYYILISDNTYEIGNKSKYYKINEKFLSGASTFELKTHSKIGKKILKKVRSDKSNFPKLEPHLRLMQKEFFNMELNYMKAYEWAENNSNDTQIISYLTSINNIEDLRFRYFKRNKTNKRLDTNLTNLKSDIKQFIIGDFVSIDLKNSQPFLLNILVNIIINKTHSTICCYLSSAYLLQTFGITTLREISKCSKNNLLLKNTTFSIYQNSTQKGTLYDDFIELYSDAISRQEIKLIMFKVLFSRNKYYKGYQKITPFEKEKKIFASVFPFVYEIVKILKNKDNTILPIYLQRLESYLFIDCIAKELVENNIIPLTIHDSVIVRAEDKEKTLKLMKTVFKQQLGVVPTFSIEYLKPKIYEKELNQQAKDKIVA